MGSLRKQYKTDATKEVEGVPITFGENDDGTQPTFNLTRMGTANKTYTKAMERVSKPFQRQIQLKTISEKNSLEIMQTVFLETVLKGWSNVTVGDVEGTDDTSFAPFNRDNAKKLITALPDLYSELLSQAQDASNYLDGVMEESAKN